METVVKFDPRLRKLESRGGSTLRRLSDKAFIAHLHKFADRMDANVKTPDSNLVEFAADFHRFADLTGRQLRNERLAPDEDSWMVGFEATVAKALRQ